MATGTIKCNTAKTLSLTSGKTGIDVQGSYIVYDPSCGTVRVYFTARSSSDMLTTDTLATIPSGYRPKADTRLFGVFYNNAGVPLSYFGVARTNGTITQGAGNTMRDIFLTGEYSV